MKIIQASPIRSPLLFGAMALMALLALRLYHLFNAPHLLFADEAQYWDWAQTLEWGYYSKPPMVAWLIAGSTSLCGDGEGCIRLLSPILHAGTAIIVSAIGTLLYNRSVGLWAGIGYMTLPAIAVASSLISTDAPLLFCWSAALLCWVLALRRPTPWRFIHLGIWLGLGMLSKYTMGMLAVSMVFYHLFYERRRILWSRLLLAFTVAALVYAPNLWWNVTHGMASYSHTMDISRVGRVHTLHWLSMLQFLLSQIAVVGPILAIFIVAGLTAAIRNLTFCVREEVEHISPDALLLTATLTLLLTILALSPLAGVKANWAGPCYISGLLLGISWAHKRAIIGWIVAAILLHILLNMVWMRYDTLAEKLHITTHAHGGHWWERDPYYRQRGWDTLGKEVAQLQQKFGGLPLLVTERKLMAVLRYYVPPHPSNIWKWNEDGRIENHYDLTRDIAHSSDTDVIALLDPGMAEDIKKHFATATHVSTVYWQPTSDHKRSLELWVLRGFRGYAKPPLAVRSQ